MNPVDSQFAADGNDYPAMPWDGHPSIYEHICAYIRPDQPGLPDEAYRLPDEERMKTGADICWAAGAMDGVATHHMGFEAPDNQVEKSIELLLAYCQQPTVQNKADIYHQLLELDMVAMIDPVIQGLLEHDDINHERLYELARSFATEACDRQPVKFGIAVLGLFEVPDNEQLFQQLGRHDEFTLFCAVAIANSLQDDGSALWELAKNVEGWGRIHAVERLCDTDDPQIKDWLIRDGFRNTVMYEYLAYVCATAGELKKALSSDSVDRSLLTATGEILQALVVGGPAETIDDYEDGAEVVSLYLQHVEHAEPVLSDFVAVNAIKSFIDDVDADWTTRVEFGWTNQLRTQLQERCQRIMHPEIWTARVQEVLVSDDDDAFYQANHVASTLGMETWDHHWCRLKENPKDSRRWFFAVTAATRPQQIQQVVEAAESKLDLAKIASGPGNENGIGPKYEPHSCLLYVLQGLTDHPGMGRALIEAGLSCPVVPNRNMAVAALSAWPPHQRPTETLQRLEVAMAVEPLDEIRERMQQVLDGGM